MRVTPARTSAHNLPRFSLGLLCCLVAATSPLLLSAEREPDTIRFVAVTQEWPLRVEALDADQDGWDEDWDCDDTNPAVYPEAPQICGDGVNNDCGDSHWPTLRTWGEQPLWALPGAGIPGVAAADLDGDGDLDCLAAGDWSDDTVFYPGTLRWHENVEGDGRTWAHHLIWESTDLDLTAARVADLDGDMDPDLLVATRDEQVFWHENVLGDASTWSERTIATSAGTGAFAADVDGDGDLDVVSRGTDETGAAWYENMAGDGSAWAEHAVFSLAGFNSATDLDGDGDVDLLCGSSSTGAAASWHENVLGDGSVWAEHPIDATYASQYYMNPVDLDGDGDHDVLVAAMTYPPSPFGHPPGFGIFWYENKLGPGPDWTEHTIVLGSGYPSTRPADIDGDGDPDVVLLSYGSSGYGAAGWYENVVGDGSVWTGRWIGSALAPSSAFAADLDGDEDLDLLCGSYEYPDVGTITWFEQMSLEADEDSDGVCEPDDCDDSDGLSWAVPGEVLDLRFSGDRETLSWTEPAEPGCDVPLYDTLRTTAPGDFVNAATCVESEDGSDTLAVDSDLPPAWAVYYYLVCAVSPCGSGPAGTDSWDVERDLRVCP